MPCHGRCLVTVIDENFPRPYGEFYYELVATGWTHNKVVGVHLTTGMHSSIRHQNKFYYDGEEHLLGYVEWLDIDKPHGEWQAFYNQLTLKSHPDFEFPGAL